MKPQNQDNDFKYWAFISYSHSDTRWGDWLHRKLERYRVPRGLVGKPSPDGRVPKRLCPIYRDREESPVSSDLGATLKNWLERSRYLIVICSPRSAQSYWVNEEVRYFKARHGEGRVLCLIVEGEPDAASKADASSTECFPASACHSILPDGSVGSDRVDPMAADARPHADGPKRAAFKLIAGLLGVSFDELWRRQRRRRIRQVIQGALAISGLAVAAVVGSQWELGQQQNHMAVAYNIAQGKKEMDAGRRLRAAFYFARARHAGGSGHALDELLRESSKALVEPNVVLKEAPSDWITFARFVDSDHVVTAGLDHMVRVWDLKTRESKLLVGESGTIASANFSADGSRFVTAVWDGHCQIWTRQGELLGKLEHPPQVRLNWAEFSRDGEWIVTASDDQLARLWKLGAGSEPTPRLLSGHQGIVKSAVFDSTGGRVLTASFDTTVRIWDSVTGQRLLTLGPHPDAVQAAAFSPDGKRVAAACLDGSILLWNITDEKEPTKQIFHHAARVNSVSFNADGSRLLTTSDDRSAKVWSVKTGDLVLSFEQHKDLVVSGAFSADGCCIVTASKDKTAMVFDAEPKVRTLDQIAALAEELGPQILQPEQKSQKLADK
jgi:dipeptidyl aminopeptidase/acylaminoacyl peptidase